MFFRRKRKQKRDREAGLVFHWRGAKKHHLGKFIALMIAVSCFGFAAYALRIEGLEQPLVSKRTALVYTCIKFESSSPIASDQTRLHKVLGK